MNGSDPACAPSGCHNLLSPTTDCGFGTNPYSLRHPLPRFGVRCGKADAAAVLDLGLVRLSRRTLDAAFAAPALVLPSHRDHGDLPDHATA